MKLRFVLLFFALLIALPQFAQVNKKFKKTLKKNHLEFVLPPGFTDVTCLPNDELSYQGAMIHGLDTFEVHYTVESLAPLIKQYKKNLGNPLVRLAHPNNFWRGKYLQNMQVLSKIPGKDVKMGREFDEEVVKKEFNGDAGAITLFDLHSTSFAPEFKYCLMMVLHKNFECDVYVSFLGNDREVIEKMALEAFHALKFK
ncbi:MAG: hypothetical protein WC044_10500 [Crocinitomicaceae bacterium]